MVGAFDLSEQVASGFVPSYPRWRKFDQDDRAMTALTIATRLNFGSLRPPRVLRALQSSLRLEMLVPTCLVVAVMVIAIRFYKPKAVVDAAVDKAVVKGLQTAERSGRDLHHRCAGRSSRGGRRPRAGRHGPARRPRAAHGLTAYWSCPLKPGWTTAAPPPRRCRWTPSSRADPSSFSK